MVILDVNKIEDLVPFCKGKVIIGGKWVYKVKTHCLWQLETYKERVFVMRKKLIVVQKPVIVIEMSLQWLRESDELCTRYKFLHGEVQDLMPVRTLMT